MRKQLLITAVAVFSFFGASSAQTVYMENEDGVRMENNASVYAYYNSPDEEDKNTAVLSYNLVPDQKAIDQKATYQVFIEKVTHRDDTDWGIGSVCVGECIAKEDWSNEFVSTNSKQMEKPDPEAYIWNNVAIHYLIRGKYQPTGNVEFHSRVTARPVSGSVGNSVVLNVFVTNKSFASTADISLAKVSILNNVNGDCTVQYTSQSKAMKLEVFDILGNVVYSTTLPQQSSSFRIPVRLNKGLAIFRISDAGKTIFAEKIMVR